MVNQMVLSSEIEWIGYEPKKSMLQVEFIEGQIYQFDGVPERLYQDFLTSESYDEYLDCYIKPEYPHRRIR